MEPLKSDLRLDMEVSKRFLYFSPAFTMAVFISVVFNFYLIIIFSRVF